MKVPPSARVTVVIPAYNQSQFLAEAIQSALRQTLPPLEVIVVDDGSTDDTPEVAAAFGERIYYIRQRNQGLSAARNTGIVAAKAELIQLLDSDDALHPNAVCVATRAAELHPNAGVFAGGWDEVNRDGSAFAHVDAPRLPPEAFHALFDVIAVGPASRHCVRRSAFANVGLFDTTLRACEDWEMWLRMAAAGIEFVALPEATIRYRNYATSMSKDLDLMWRSGNIVLQRASHLHGECADCVRALRSGVDKFRSWCYVSMVAPQIRGACANRRYYTAGREALAAVTQDRQFGRLLWCSARSHLLPRRRRTRDR
jgi:GT2 family glycosyltransferase